MRKAQEARRPWSARRFATVALAGVMVASVVALAACSPAPSNSVSKDAPEPVASVEEPAAVSDDAAAADDTASKLESMGYSNFLNNDSGDYATNFYTEGFVNAGNRGCNACHDDLWETIKDLSPIQHLASSKPGYGQKADWTDCSFCHSGGAALGGVWLRDPIHIAHLSNEMFVKELNGNCFSCHALDGEGNYQIWDYYKHSDQMGGYKQAGADGTMGWVAGRTWETDTIGGVTVARDMAMDVKMDQEPSAREDMYQASNYVIPELDAADWTLTITGTNNDRTFTYEDLKALPQTEMTIAMMCGANGVGSYQIGNVVVKGVLLKDLIEACGGVQDGIISVGPNAADGWRFPSPMLTYDLQSMLDQNAILMMERWGEPLTVEEGFPVALATPGTPAGGWSKWLTGIDFSEQQGLPDTGAMFTTPEYIETPSAPGATSYGSMINSGWFNPANDGEVFKAGQPIELEGYAYVWAFGDRKLDQIAFSSDYGTTWTVVDVPDDFDPVQWTHWTATWTPDEPGTYELYVCAVSEAKGWQQYPSAITVVVE
uniref:Oxidoreductase molybdopterin-binding domain-containing protein n=1 Tax=Muribaculaceae bacterium Z82 TaxID=2304548 RepID=A0A7C9JPI6_9BACT